MKNIIKIAFRNLKRSSRRTLLTAALITIGVIFVLVYSALSSSFKAYMVGEITDSMMGHIQIHKKGYIASVDNLPLDKNLNKKQIDKVLEVLDNNPYVESYTFRIKLGGMFSNYVSSTNIRLNAIDPGKERKTLPLFEKRIQESEAHLLKQGEMLIPELLAKGMGVRDGCQKRRHFCLGCQQPTRFCQRTKPQGSGYRSTYIRSWGERWLFSYRRCQEDPSYHGARSK
jgi:putative ABC transport system permease protein